MEQAIIGKTFFHILICI